MNLLISVLVVITSWRLGWTEWNVSQTFQFRIALILPYSSNYQFSIFKVEPAVRIAMEKSLSRNILSKGANLTLMMGNSGCSEIEAPLTAIDMFTDKPNRPSVFLGPNCDYATAPVARYASSINWDIPVISSGAFVQTLRGNDQYRLLTRMLGSYPMIGRIISKLYEHSNWTVSGMIISSNLGDRSHLGKSDCYFLMAGIKTFLERLKHKVSFDFFDEKVKPGEVNIKGLANMSSILEAISMEARSKHLHV